MTKQMTSIRPAPARHWVGDGFPVHGMFGYDAGATARSPFLMLDYAAPTRFEPTATRRGVGAHPHRGFETVTLVYAGEVEHRDSTGQGGVIGPGDVQWMTAGAGILHDEFHSADYARQGGPFEMVQLWVDLPARHKLCPPGYQAIDAARIVTAPLHDVDGREVGAMRLIAGAQGELRGPARTFSPMNVWDLHLQRAARLRLAQPEGWPVQLLLREGRLRLADGRGVGAAQLLSFSAEGTQVELESEGEARLLLLSGEPLGQPVVGYGPFVMTRREEIVQAFEDFQAGRFGQMEASR
ncbi:MAG: pirin family protein [Burkholderiaceae bacterium]|nr:pirin family protein [Burkholderiaceae bacterium]